jgi:hypothetical protein
LLTTYWDASLKSTEDTADVDKCATNISIEIEGKVK